MKKELEESLHQKYPKILCGIGKIWCDDGWYDLIDSVCSSVSSHIELHKIDFKFTQVKEKFAGLRMYSEGEDNFISGVVYLAETLSFRICEVSGSPGVRCVSGGYIRTLSPVVAEELGFKLI